jgi:glycosyltransferase involved in cell wall biosynthesis
MRVGLLTADLSPRHGWGRYARGLIAALEQAGIAVEVVCAANTPLDAAAGTHPLLPALVPRQRRFLPRLLAAYPLAWAALRRCSVIHCAAEPYAPLAAWIAGSRPLFITGHGSYIHLPLIERPPLNRLYAWAFRRSTLVCVSRYTASIAEQVLPGIRTEVIPNGVDSERFASIIHRGDTQQPVILAVGAVKARRGTLQLVQAMPAVRTRFPSVRCQIVGALDAEPVYAAQVQAAIEQLGLNGCVELLGSVSEAELLDSYSRASLFVGASLNEGWKFEGFGLAHLEASAAGLPVIGTRGCGIEDAVEEGITGLLVDQSRLAEELPQAILRLLGDSALAGRMGAAGCERARRFSWDAAASRLIDAYHQQTTME